MLDTNVVVAGILGARECRDIVSAVLAGEVLGLSTFDTEEEYRTSPNHSSIRRLSADARVSGQRFLTSLADYLIACRMIYPTGDAPTGPDKRARKFLHCAFAANADFLITLDARLLDLELVGETHIVRPREFLSAFETERR